ncbi:MAG: MFS transporter [Herminiimonas sp.]|nr:MFS transporter [Herminiimonas sp.]
MNLLDSPTSDTEAIPRSAVIALSFAAFGSGVSLRVTDPLLPRLAQEFSVSLGNAALVVTAFSIAYGLAQLFFGPMGDRFGKYLVVGWACLACSLTALLCALAPDLPLLLLARMLAGATAAAVIPLSMAWIGDVIVYEQRQPVLARFLIGQIMGLSAGVMFGGFAAEHLGWRTPFFAVAAFFVVIGLVLLSINRRLPIHARLIRRVDGSAWDRMLFEFSQVLAVPWARVVLGTVFLEGMFLYGAFAFIVSHLHLIHSLPLSTAGTVVMLFGFGGLLFALCVTQLVKTLGEVGLTRWGGTLVTLAYLTVAFAPVWWWAVPASFVAGLGFYMLHNTLQINATQMAPERRGAAVSAFASSFFLGQSVGVGLSGLLLAQVGTTGILATGSLGVLLVAWNFSRLRAQRVLPSVSL